MVWWLGAMGDQNLEHLDDEELLSLFEATEKLLLPIADDRDSTAGRKTESIKRKLSLLEQEMRLRSLWESEQEE